jgi:uncharacterized protein (TIGR02679 family)
LNPTQEAIQYFRKETSYSRLFEKFAYKIESLGTVGGSVTLNQLSQDEKRALRNWFSRDYSSIDKATINLLKFSKGFTGTRFEGSDLFDVVEGVVGRKLIYKKEAKELEEIEKQTYFIGLRDRYSHEYTSLLTESILKKEPAVVGYIASYNQKDYGSIENIYKALATLPVQKGIRLPVFAEKITGDPHFFDKDTKFYSTLQLVRNKLESISSIPENNAEYHNELLYNFGILKDDISNFVSCYGLLGERNGKLLKSWEYDYIEKNVKNVPLRELNKIEKVYPKKGNTIFIVENSGVFSSILDKHDGAPIPLICTHGQFKLAGLLLIQKLVETNNIIYYSGDYDPEGIQMASKLKGRYGTSIRYWRYSVDDYRYAATDRVIPDERLSKLGNIQDEELIELITTMKKYRVFGYQERHINNLYNDILCFTNKTSI